MARTKLPQVNKYGLRVVSAVVGSPRGPRADAGHVGSVGNIPLRAARRRPGCMVHRRRRPNDESLTRPQQRVQRMHGDDALRPQRRRSFFAVRFFHPRNRRRSSCEARKRTHTSGTHPVDLLPGSEVDAAAGVSLATHMRVNDQLDYFADVNQD